MSDKKYPETSYILNALKALIKNQKASDFSDNLANAAIEKKKMIDMYTHDFLLENIDDYLEKEKQVSETIKDGIIDFLTGAPVPKPKMEQLTPAKIVLNDEYYFHEDDEFVITPFIENNNEIYQFTYKWKLLGVEQDITIDPDDQFQLILTLPIGTYLFNFRIYCIDTGMSDEKNITVHVLEKETSSSSSGT